MMENGHTAIVHHVSFPDRNRDRFLVAVTSTISVGISRDRVLPAHDHVSPVIEREVAIMG